MSVQPNCPVDAGAKSEKISLALKITNWCNLNCCHCCERSGPTIAPNMMTPGDIARYVAQYRDIKMPKFDLMVVTGGETMAPYYHNDFDYMPACLHAIYSGGMIPVLKTNGVWGHDEKLAQRILNDIAQVAYVYGRVVTLDMSLDEFHDNGDAVASIINQVFYSLYIMSAVRICLTGFHQSFTECVSRLIGKLTQYNIYVCSMNSEEMVLLDKSRRGMQVFLSGDAGVHKIGRAADNGLGRAMPSGCAENNAHCIMVDNQGIAQLNDKYRAALNNRPLAEVVHELFGRIKS